MRESRSTDGDVPTQPSGKRQAVEVPASRLAIAGSEPADSSQRVFDVMVRITELRTYRIASTSSLTAIEEVVDKDIDTLGEPIFKRVSASIHGVSEAKKEPMVCVRRPRVKRA